MADEKSVWEKGEIVAKGFGLVFIPIVVAGLGFYFSQRLNQDQQSFQQQLNEVQQSFQEQLAKANIKVSEAEFFVRILPILESDHCDQKKVVVIKLIGHVMPETGSLLMEELVGQNAFDACSQAVYGESQAGRIPPDTNFADVWNDEVVKSPSPELGLTKIVLDLIDVDNRTLRSDLQVDNSKVIVDVLSTINATESVNLKQSPFFVNSISELVSIIEENPVLALENKDLILQVRDNWSVSTNFPVGPAGP